MPLTPFQRELLAVIAPARTPDSYLAGGTALHFAPDSTRYSRDIDLFHDAEERVAEAFSQDRKLLERNGYALDTLISQPGLIRAVVSRDGVATRIDWARDSAWRFMPVVRDELGGFILHDVDLATNKVLALAGRDEPRDYVDTLFVMETILTLGPLIWAAVAKDPGYSPLSLLEQIKRRGRFRPEDMSRLDLVHPVDLVETKRIWLSAVSSAEAMILALPPEDVGCLYYSRNQDRFVEPTSDTTPENQGLVRHFGRLGGILPRPTDQSIRPD